MTVHLISVGKSIVEALEDPLSKELELGLCEILRATRPYQLLPEKDPARASTQLSAWLGTEGPNRTELRKRLAASRPELWPDRVSAELQTFARVQGDRRVRPADLAVLVATDTPAGLISALLNAAALTSGEVRRVRYLATPDELGAAPLDRQGTSVLIVRIPGLDAGDEGGFQKAMRGLGALGRYLVRDGGELGESVQVHLSGGYKAAIPYLIGLAEGLRSLPARPGCEVRAVVLHEETTSGAINLPLRRIPADRVRTEMRQFDRDGFGPKPERLTLDGYAYEREADRYRLTAFGEGLRALIGDTPETLGG